MAEAVPLYHPKTKEITPSYYATRASWSEYFMKHYKNIITEVETLADFQELCFNPEEKRLIMIDLYNPTFGPCKQIMPTLSFFKDASLDWDGQVIFMQVPLDLVPEFAEQYPRTSLPQFLFYSAGELVSYHKGIDTTTLGLEGVLLQRAGQKKIVRQEKKGCDPTEIENSA